MRRRCLLTLLLPGVMLLLAACQRAETPTTQTLALQPTSTPTPTQTQTTLPPTPSLSATRTLWATPVDLSTATPIPSPTFVYENSFAVDFSADGSRLAFNSSVDGLVPEDQNHMIDPLIYHPENGSIQWVRTPKENPSGKDTPSLAASLSANGRFLLFGGRSNAPEPAADHYYFIFLRDLETGQDERIDLVPLEKQLAVSSIQAVLSPDGRYLALEAVMGNWNIYLLEHATGKITPVTELPDGSLPDGNSYGPVFSPDGRFLAFVSDAHNLVAGDERCSEDNPNCGDVFVYDLTTGKLERIPAQLRFAMGYPYPYLTVSTNARFLAWTELEDAEIHFRPVIRLFDRQTGTMETICAGESICSGHSPSISADGRWLAFGTISGIKPDGSGDPDSPAQVYLFDRQTGSLTLISAGKDGQQGDGRSGMIQLQSEGFSSDIRISGDGRFVAFSSQAANLLPAGVAKRQCFDPNMIGAYACYDLFLYDRQSDTLNWISRPK